MKRRWFLGAVAACVVVGIGVGLSLRGAPPTPEERTLATNMGGDEAAFLRMEALASNAKQGRLLSDDDWRFMEAQSESEGRAMQGMVCYVLQSVRTAKDLPRAVSVASRMAEHDPELEPLGDVAAQWEARGYRAEALRLRSKLKLN